MPSPTRIPRLRAAAYVERPEGILLVGIRGMGLLLPGGGVHPGEDERAAAIRELAEETGLATTRAWPLLRHESTGMAHVVYYIETTGTPAPANEIHSLAYLRPGAALALAPVTRAILDQIARLRRDEPARFRLPEDG
jgi:8-oxo-dGTP pyrophosphatase MutT (NUDIX family)